MGVSTWILAILFVNMTPLGNHQQKDCIVNLNEGSMTPARMVFSSPSASARCLLLAPPPALLQIRVLVQVVPELK